MDTSQETNHEEFWDMTEQDKFESVKKILDRNEDYIKKVCGGWINTIPAETEKWDEKELHDYFESFHCGPAQLEFLTYMLTFQIGIPSSIDIDDFMTSFEGVARK